MVIPNNVRKDLIMMKDRTFTIRVSEEFLEKLKDEAAKQDLTVSWYVRKLIKNELDRLAEETRKELEDLQNN